MRILVTGAAGFVGQHLVGLLAGRGDTVFGTYLGPPPRRPSRGAELLACDIRDQEQVRQVVRQARPHQVYHLAALSSVTRSFAEARQVWEANFWGAMNLLEALRENAPQAAILLVGSSQSYGRVAARQLPITEDHALAPESPYAASKAAADLLGLQYFHSWKLHVIRARPFNHTGPGQSTEFLCSDLARQAAEIDMGLRPPLVALGNTRVQRDFSDVRDVVRAYALLLQRGTPGEAYNVGSGRAVSVRQIVEWLQALSSKPFRIKVEAKRVRANEVAKLYGSNRKLRRATSWSPVYNLETTLRDLFFHWKALLQREARAQSTCVSSSR